MGNAVARVNGTAYKILGTLSEGGSATVYEVRRRGSRRHFALKWVRGVRDADALERLLLEIRVHRQLCHANILPLVDAEVRASAEAPANSSLCAPTHDGRVALASGTAHTTEVLLLVPICSHGSLQTKLDDAFQKGETPFTERECLRIFAALVDAVQHVHTAGYVHRNLKPGNVLLSDASPAEPMLMDFGSIAPLGLRVRSAAHHAALCEEAATLCSAPYRPPELWAASGYTPHAVLDSRTDVWQLGCLLYAMAFGPFSPFESAREGVLRLAILNGTVRFPAAAVVPHASRFSRAFTSFITWMLTPDVARRPTLDAVRQQLQQLRAASSGDTSDAAMVRALAMPDSYCSNSSVSIVFSSFSAPTSSSSAPSALPPPPTQVLSFSKLANDEWADFAAFEKVARGATGGADSVCSSDESGDWGELTEASDAAAAGRSTSTSVLSMGTLVWSNDSIAAAAAAELAPAPPMATRRQSTRRHSIGALVAPVQPSERESELRRALSTRGRLLLSQALDNRASQ